MPLSLVLLISVILNCILLWFVARRLLVLYRGAKLRRAQRYSRRNSHFATNPVTSTDVIFLGDSITEGGEWSALFPAQFQNCRVRNFGIGSDTVTGVLERLAPIIAGQPQAIFLMIGTNDIGLDVPQAQSRKSYKEIVERIRASSPNTTLYIQSILPRKVDEQISVTVFNEDLKSLAFEQGAKYMDLYLAFATENGEIDERFSNDHLHLLGPGYRLWQQLIGGYLGKGKEHEHG